MPYSVEGKLVVAISSRALLDFEDENRIFERDGEDAYIALQLARLDVPAREGVAFPLVKKLLAFNTPQAQRVEVVILSKNDPVSGLRVFRSAEVRIAFDGDAVLFSDESERVYQKDGLDAFTRQETAHALQPLPPGPFKPLLEALQRLQAAAGTDVPMRLRTALVTARSAPAHERAVRTLMEWSIAVDEAMFLGGLDKGAFLKAFEPDFYFDDQRGHVDSARAHVAAGHVPFGVANLR